MSSAATTTESNQTVCLSSQLAVVRGSCVGLHPAALPSLHRTILQTVLIHQILQHITSISSGHVGIGICLCLALFATEFTKVLFWALAWAINYRTAIRLKVALSTLVFENLLSFKTLTHISAGEVSGAGRGVHLKHWSCSCECVGCAAWMEYLPLSRLFISCPSHHLPCQVRRWRLKAQEGASQRKAHI